MLCLNLARLVSLTPAMGVFLTGGLVSWRKHPFKTCLICWCPLGALTQKHPTGSQCPRAQVRSCRKPQPWWAEGLIHAGADCWGRVANGIQFPWSEPSSHRTESSADVWMRNGELLRYIPRIPWWMFVCENKWEIRSVECCFSWEGRRLMPKCHSSFTAFALKSKNKCLLNERSNRIKYGLISSFHIRIQNSKK